MAKSINSMPRCPLNSKRCFLCPIKIKKRRGETILAKLNAQQKQNRRNASHSVFKHIGENYLSVLPIVLVVTVLYFVKIDPSFSLQVYLAFLMSAFVIGLGLSL